MRDYPLDFVYGVRTGAYPESREHNTYYVKNNNDITSKKFQEG